MYLYKRIFELKDSIKQIIFVFFAGYLNGLFIFASYLIRACMNTVTICMASPIITIQAWIDGFKDTH